MFIKLFQIDLFDNSALLEKAAREKYYICSFAFFATPAVLSGTAILPEKTS